MRLIYGFLLATLTWFPCVAVADELASLDIEPQSEREVAAFALEIEAPEAIRQLLHKHLDLVRFRSLNDLTELELSRLVTQTPNNIKGLVSTMGYFAPTVTVEIQPRTGSARVPTVSIRVEPGVPTRVVQVDITLVEGSASVPQAIARRQEIEDQWVMGIGTIFTQDQWSSAKQMAVRQLLSSQFPAGRIASSDVAIQPEGAFVKLVLDPGNVYAIGDLLVRGTKRYGTDLVARLSRLSPGQIYDHDAMLQAQQHLLDSGYFDSVQVTLDVNGDASAAPVLVTVTEAPLQKLVLGIGGSTDGGARLSATHTHHLLPLIGWRAVTKLALDRNNKSVGSEFTSQPDDNYWQWVSSFEFQTEQLGSFDVESQRFRAGRGQAGLRFDQNYYLQYDRAQAATTQILQTLVVESLSFNSAFTLRQFDSVPFPSSGWGLGLEIGGGSTIGTTSDPYGRFMARAQAYVPLGDRASARARHGRLALRAQLGAVIAQEDVSIPSTQLFVTGGDTSVRGFSRGEIGRDLPGTLVTAGRYLVVGSAEWQRPIVNAGVPSQWESAVFMDAGAVANTPGEFSPRAGVGAGVRWKTPVGPLQLDLAYGLPRGHLHLHMNLGFAF
jgi:translocation and assembly module TamA